MVLNCLLGENVLLFFFLCCAAIDSQIVQGIPLLCATGSPITKNGKTAGLENGWMFIYEYFWSYCLIIISFFSLLSNKLGLIVCDYMKIYCCKLQLLQCLLTPTVKGRTNLKIKEKYLSPAGSTTKGLTVSRSNSSLSLYSSASAPTSPKTCKASLWHATHFVE